MGHSSMGELIGFTTCATLRRGSGGWDFLRHPSFPQVGAARPNHSCWGALPRPDPAPVAAALGPGPGSTEAAIQMKRQLGADFVSAQEADEEDCCQFLRQTGLRSKFQDSLGYIVRSYFKNK